MSELLLLIYIFYFFLALRRLNRNVIDMAIAEGLNISSYIRPVINKNKFVFSHTKMF